VLAVEIAELRRVFDRPILSVATVDPVSPGTEFRGALPDARRACWTGT
jgi:hypothetical protein